MSPDTKFELGVWDLIQNIGGMKAILEARPQVITPQVYAELLKAQDDLGWLVDRADEIKRKNQAEEWVENAAKDSKRKFPGGVI